MLKKTLQSTLLWSAAAFIVVVVPLILWLVPPPFFSATTVEVRRGATISEVAQKISDAGVVYTPELITISLLIKGDNVTAGAYKFNSPVNAITVADRLAAGDFQMPQAKVVIPEGFTNEQIAERLRSELDEESFSAGGFLDQARDKQGYLYPDTYRLHTDATAEEVISLMEENFYEQISSLEEEINNFDHSLSGVVKVASLIELEAADYEIRRRISGVLWKRLAEGMPLQVDAVFVSILGKNTYELTHDDLRTESPYNLYRNTGLPPTPIANPGIDSIRAAVNPITSDDLYYLSDRDKNFYFTSTLSEHNQNKRKYLQTDEN